MEGSDASITQFQTFYTANVALIEGWVSGGGHLFVNVARNGGPATMSLGFGGVTMNNSQFTPTATITIGQTGHPIFNGPILGVGNTWTGGSYGHATITGGTPTKLIDGIGGASVLSVLDYGNGRVLFGGMTMTNFHAPLPQADNLRRNMLSFLNTGFNACLSARYPVVVVSTPAPPMAVIAGTTSLCENTCTTLDVDASGLANYQTFEWTPATGLNVTTGPSVVACPTTTTTYIVTGFDAINGCSNTDTVVITVTPAPVITAFTQTPNPVCSGDSAQMTVVATPFITPASTVASYSFAQSVTAYTPISGGTVLSATGVINDDLSYSNVPIGYTFNYHGVPNTLLGISANAYMQFGGVAPGNFYNGVSIQNLANAIHPFSEDLHGTSPTCEIQYQTTEVVGN